MPVRNLNGEGNFASAGGIWMGGAGPVADSDGNVYVTTGNGPWDGQTAWGDSVLKFGPNTCLWSQRHHAARRLLHSLHLPIHGLR